MLCNLWKKIKFNKTDGYRKHKVLIAVILAVCCIAAFFFTNLYQVQSESDSYVLGKKGSAVAGTKSGNASIWPVTHPVFIVKFYPTKISTASTGGYNDTVNSIKKVIPYTGSDSLWICSNTLSEYLYRQKFNSDTQVYLARRTSINGSLKLNGGKNDPETTGRIVYFDSSHRINVNPAKDGVFYQKVLGLFIENNRNFQSLSKDPKFIELLTKPSSAKVSDSLKVWSFITDTNTKGSDKEGWTYTVDIKKNMEDFMNYSSLPSEFVTSNWKEQTMTTYNTNGLDNKDN